MFLIDIDGKRCFLQGLPCFIIRDLYEAVRNHNLAAIETKLLDSFYCLAGHIPGISFPVLLRKPYNEATSIRPLIYKEVSIEHFYAIRGNDFTCLLYTSPSPR